ncbi:hypothetical protein PTSG_08093 [Salpingoeca rosetta]|uniref:Dynamin N-terminal domain-containing protein n=1 Tax=Salpingoeca rosetta (strain ATCC 50818 / BSB-021) TaxID=946362 RepID=F2UHZ3_SALR5|nr:uncharacterized protein PTSG_08093 [Salpingoeca rosetta]EGD76742.1 hypothetical protein PTSG_08093 [Salpingoeca rosetta]|eukprot:XP_004991114.1 hypothetical protein PTSG_08093 [Salpingoeca rosetta]
MSLNSLDNLTFTPLNKDAQKVVIAADGRAYNRTTLEEYFAMFPDKARITSPLTGERMTDTIRDLTLAESLELQHQNVSFYHDDEEEGIFDADASVIASFNEVMPEAIRTLLAQDFGGLLSTDTVPHIVSIGPENIGKSLALQRLIGRPLFPVANELMTRMPTMVKLRHGPTRMPTVWVQYAQDDEAAGAVQGDKKAVRCRAFTGEHAGETAELLEDAVPVPWLAEAIKERMATLMAEEKDEQGRLLRVSLKYEIVVELHSPYYFNADILDLPGIIQAEGHNYAPRPEDTQDLAKRYVRRYRDNALFLLTSKVTTPANQNPAMQLLHEEHLDHVAIGVITHADQYPTDLLQYGDPNHFINAEYGWTPLAAGLGQDVRAITASVLHALSTSEQQEMARLQPPTQNRDRFHMGGIKALRRCVCDGLEHFFGHVIIGQLVQMLSMHYRKNSEAIAALGVPFEDPTTKAATPTTSGQGEASNGEASSDDEYDDDATLTTYAQYAQPCSVVQAAVRERTIRALTERKAELYAAMRDRVEQLIQPFHDLHDHLLQQCKTFAPSSPLPSAEMRRFAGNLMADVRHQVADLERELRNNNCFSALVRDFVRTTLTADASAVRLERFGAHIRAVADSAAAVVAERVDQGAAECVSAFMQEQLRKTSQLFSFCNKRLVYRLVPAASAADPAAAPTLGDLVEFDMAGALTFDFERDIVQSAVPETTGIDTTEDARVTPTPSALTRTPSGNDAAATTGGEDARVPITEQRRELLSARARMDRALAEVCVLRQQVYEKDVENDKARARRFDELEKLPTATDSVRRVADRLNDPECNISRITISVDPSDGSELLLGFAAHATSVGELTITGLLQDSTLRRIVQCINTAHELRHISFCEMAFGERQFKTLLETLAAHINLDTITFEACGLTDDNIPALVDLIESDWRCTVISLPGNNFSDDGWQVLQQAAHEHRQSEALARWLAYNTLHPTSENDVVSVFVTEEPAIKPFLSQDRTERGPTIEDLSTEGEDLAAEGDDGIPEFNGVKLERKEDLLRLAQGPDDFYEFTQHMPLPTTIHVANLLGADVAENAGRDDVTAAILNHLPSLYA